MAELPDVVPGEPIDASTFGNPVIDRVLSRYADSSARDAAVPLPVDGDFAWLATEQSLQVYNGTLAAWQTFLPLEAGLDKALSGVLYINRTSSGMFFMTRSSVAAPQLGQFDYQILGAGGLQLGGAEAGGANPVVLQTWDRTKIETFAALTQAAGGRILRAAAEGDVLQRWNGDSDADTGRYFEWRRGTFGVIELYGIEGSSPNLMGILRAGGSSDWKQLRVMASNDGFGNLSVENMSTDGAAANVVYPIADGRLRYNTSARRFKSDIEPLADSVLDARLNPVSFRHEDGKDYLGFVAEEIAEIDERGGVYHDGEILNYDPRAVIAILAKQVNALEARVAELEAN